MKPKFRSLISAFAPLSRSSLIVVASLCTATSVHADQIWTGASGIDALWTTTSNWNTTAPGPTDIAIFNSTSTNLATTLGADRSILGLRVVDPSAAVSIGVGNTLTLGTSGIDMSSSTQNLTIDAAVTIGGAQPWTVANGRTLTINGALTNATPITKSGDGTLTLTNTANVTSGGLIVSGGILRAGNTTNFGNGGTGAGIITIQGGATVNSAFPSGNTWVCANPFDIPFGQTGNLNTPVRMRMNGAVTGSGILNFNVTTGGTARMDLQSTWVGFTGEINFTGAGTVRMGINALATGQPLFPAAGWAGAKVNIGGTVTLAPNTNGAGNTVSIGYLAGTSATGLGERTAGGLATWSIGALGLDSIYDGGIVGSNNVTKVGGGTLTLTNAAALTYTGATTITQGSLKINGVKSGVGATTVNGTNPGRLTGIGSVAGTTTVASGGQLSPGDDLVAGGIGNITLSNLTLAAGSFVNLEFGSGNDTVTVPVGGVLTLNPGVKINAYAGTELGTVSLGTNGTYPIINVTPAQTSGFNSSTFVIQNGVPGKVYSFTQTATAINLVVGDTDPSNYWNVDGSGSWATASNWTKNSVPNTIGALAKVGPGPGGLPGGSFSGPLTITLDGNKIVGELTLREDFSPTITIDPGLTTPGTLVMDNGILPAGIVSVMGSHVINAPVLVDAQGVGVDVAGTVPTTLTMNGVISGPSGFLTKTGSGTLILTGTNTYDGGTILSGGAININSAASLGSVSGAAIFAGGTLQLANDLSGITRSYLVSGASSAIIDTNTFAFGYAGVIAPTGGGTGGLTKTGAGTMTLSTAHTYTGTTAVTGGILELASGASISGSAANISGGGSQLVVNGGSITSTATSNIGNGSLGFLLSAGSATFAALNMNDNTNNNTVARVDGGILTATSFSTRRNASALTGVPTQGFTNIGLYVTGGIVNISGAMDLGTAASTSNVGARFDGGTVTVGGVVTIGGSQGSRYGVLDVNGAIFTSTNAVTGVQVGTGATNPDYFLIRAGIATVERIQLGAGANASTSVVNLSGGTLYVGSGGIVQGSTDPAFIASVQLGTATLGAKANWSTLLGATLNGTTVIKAADAADVGRNITIAGVVGGTGGLEKTGAGTLTLSGANIYAGTTTITAGKLAITGDQSGAGGNVSVASGASLAGSGNIGGNVTIDGGGRQEFAIAASSGAQPLRTITGTLNLTGGTFLDLTAAGPVASGVYTLATASSINGVLPTAGNYSGLSAVASIVGGGTTLIVTITASDFDNWITGFSFAPGANLTTTGDPDGDGLNNLQEYAFGLDPSSGSSVSPITAQLNNATGLFTYTRRLPSLTGMTYVYEYSTTLASWTDFTPDSTSTNSGNPIEAITVDVPNALLSNTSLFVRVRAVK